jgi:2-polyprenyl-3-methyl-5-hydroxy-6-metoxy-1,4-benzoquinol methylase
MNSRTSEFNVHDLEIVDSRSDFILNYVRKKRVLHIGCVDSGMYDERKKHGGFLHSTLSDEAGTIIGIDIDQAGLDTMKKDGYENIYCFDILKSSDLKSLSDLLKAEGGVDLIFAGEVIEHVPDPIKFVTAILKLKKEFDALCIITTPNPYYFGSIYRALRGGEAVHPDHNFYFSFKTLNTVFRKSGFEGHVQFKAYLNLSASFHRRLVKRLIAKISPLYADGIIAIF